MTILRAGYVAAFLTCSIAPAQGFFKAPLVGSGSVTYVAAGDIDGDGDLDLVGRWVFFNCAFDGSTAGQRRQYGASVSGTGGSKPILTSRGPLRSGLTVQMQLRHGVGGGFSLLVGGLNETVFPSTVWPGLTLYTRPILHVLGCALTGTPGQQGGGSCDLPIAIPTGLLGLQFYFQHLVFDAGAANGIAHTNGLELTVGN